MAVYVKGKLSITYAVFGLAYGGGACACPPTLSLRPCPTYGRRGGGREGVLRADRDIFTVLLFIAECD